VLEGAQGDGLVEVTMPVVEAGAGLVFRYLDPDNFWAVIADPEAGNWAIWKTIDGEATPVDTVEASTADGVTVTTIQTDRTLRILIDGEDVLLLEDGALSDRLQGGLLGPADGDGTARWDRFLVLSAPT
jgi:hypothetical protein